MWKAIIGKSFERSEAPTSQSSRRKDEVDKSASRRRSSESIVSSRSARKPTRGEERDRGFNPSSTSYSSTSRTAYPGTAPASVASSYATASSNQADQTFTPPGLVRNASLADRMPKPRGSRDERRRDSDRDQRGERRERSTSRERRSNHRERSRSRDREDKRRSTRRAYDEQQSGHDLARGLSRSGDGYVDDQSTARAGDYSVQASGNFGAQVGSSGFTQFPGQYDGGLPAFAPEPSPAPVNMSSHVPDQFPGQFPSQAAAPYRPPLAATEGGLGLAAEYYGDTGESVAHQPGVRPQPPTLIVGAEPHLQAASPIAAPPPEPSATGNVGAAASFFSGADDYQPLPSSKPPKPGKQSKPDNSSKPNRPSGGAVVTGGAALGFAAASSSTSSAHAGPGGTPNMSFVQPSSNVPTRPSVGYPPSTTSQSTSHHSSSAPAIPTLGAAAAGTAAGYMISHQSSSQQSRPSGISSGGNGGSYVTAPSQRPGSQRPHSQAHSTYVPVVSNGRPDHPGKHSSHSNVPLYAAGLASTAGAAAAVYQSYHSPPHSSYNHPYASGSMAQRHRHRGPLSKLIDFIKDPDGVAEFEEYTEYIGVCKHCFSPGSSPRDAPRKHHYRRRGSNERYGSSTRIDKESRYWSSDGESRRKKGNSWLATGMAGYGLGKIGKSFSRAPENDFGGYSARSGRGNHSSWSLGSRTSEHPDKRGHASHGVTHRSSDTRSRHRSRSRERVETGITSEGKLYKKDRHGSFFGGPTMTTYEARRRRSRSRSSSRDRRSGVASAAIGGIIGSSMPTSTLRHRSRSPEKGFAKTKRRSREQSPSAGSKHGKGASYSSHGGPLAPSFPYIDSLQSHSKPDNPVSGRFFSSRPEKPPRRKKKSRGFFSFSNSSSSSSDAGLAYGSALETRMSSKQSTAKWNNSRNTNAAILSLGAAAAALAATDHSSARRRRRRPDLVAVKEPRSKHGNYPERSRNSRSSSTSSSSEDGAWEDASEDDDSSSASSGLAYGGAARKSQDSLLSEASGTSKWGWRWGSSKKKKDPGYPVTNVGHPIAPASAGLGGLGAHFTGEAAAFDNRRDGAMSSVSSLPSMQHVYPIPTSDPSRFDVSRQSSTMSSNHPIVTSRPAAIPLQQPQPIAPVSSAVYTSQAPYAHSYSAPTGPPVFSGLTQARPAVTDIRQARMTSSPDRTMPGTFPFQQSELEGLPNEASSGRSRRRRDSSPASRTEVVKPTSSRRRNRASTQDQGSSVRVDVAKEQADKERRNRRRQEEEDEANRQRVLLREEKDREEREKQRKRRLKEEEDQANRQRVLLREAKDREEREKQRKRRLKEEEDEANRQRVLLREVKDRDDREKQRTRRLKEEEDAEQERFRLDAFKKQRERHNRDKRRIPEEEEFTQENASPHKSEDRAAIGGERQPVVGTKRDGILRSETQPLGNNERALEESKKMASWATPGVIGAAGAIIAAAAAEKKASSAEDYQAKRRNEQRSNRDSVENGGSKMKSSMRQSPSQASDDMRDREAQVARKVAPKAAPSSRHEDYATYFAPIELLARSGNQQQGYDPNRDDEGASDQTPHIITIEPSGRKSPCYSPADASNEAPYGRVPNRVPLAWVVPALNLIEPTPPHSIAGSSRGDASPITRPENVTIAEINQPEKPSTASKVTWGEPETVEYTVVTPLESREEFISNPNVPPTLEEVIEVVTIAPSVAPAMAGKDIRDPIVPVDEVIVRHMPGEFGDDLEFAATLAAGLQDTGFDPAIVIDDPTYRRRDSPPGSESTNFYRQPFCETVTDLGLDSPGTEGAPPQRGFIEGELPSTPQDEEIPSASGDFDILSKKLSKKGKREQKQAAKDPEMNDSSTTGSSLSKPSTKDEIPRTPEKYFEEPESMDSVPSGPSDDPVGPANASRLDRDRSMDRTGKDEITSPRSVSHYRTDPQGYFDDQQTIPRSPTHKTKQDAWMTDLAASVPLPEDTPDDLSSSQGPSLDDFNDHRADTNKARTPRARPNVAPTGFPDTEDMRPGTSTDLTRKPEAFGFRPDPRRSSQDDSPSRYAESLTRFSPETQEDEEQGQRKKKSKRVSEPDEWSDKDTRSISAPAPEPDEYRKPRKSKKKSKRDSIGFDDAVSAISAPAAIEDDKTSRSKNKKDKKGGLFGLFGSSRSYENPPETRKVPSEATVEDFQEQKKKSKRKSKDRRSSSGDVYDVYGAAAQSVGDLSQIGQPREDSKDRKSQKSKERRHSRKESTVDSGITTQELPSKDEHRTSSTEETGQSTPLDDRISTRAESQDNMESFLGVGNDMPSVPDGVEPALSTRAGEDPSQAPQPIPQPRTPFSELFAPAVVRTPSPQTSDLADFAGKLAQDAPISPTFAPAPREQRTPGLQPTDHIPVPPASPSPTAIPIHFRTPRPSVGFVRASALSSPTTAPDSPSSVVPRTRHARPGSTEFRPLWLVERHKSREQFDPEEPFPSLPSSKTTSRSSSVHDTADVDANDETPLAPGDGSSVLGVNVERCSEPQEFLDSQQPTPVATNFSLAVRQDESSGKHLDSLSDAEINRDAHDERPDSLASAPSSPPLRSLGDVTGELPDKVLPAHFEDLQNLPPLPPSSSSSVYGDDELLSSSAIKDAAVAMGTLVGDATTDLLSRDRSDEQMSLPSDPIDNISDPSGNMHLPRDVVQPLDVAESQEKIIESEVELDLLAADKPLEGPYWHAKLTTSTPDQGITVDEALTDSTSPSQAANLASAEEQRELQEQDAQDAVDSWFAPLTSKKGKKEKQSKKQKKPSIANNKGASKASPSASTSSSELKGALIVAIEALTEEQDDFALPEGLSRSQSDQKELSPTPVIPVHREPEQDESGPQSLPTLQSVEEDAEWPERNRKSKKEKGKGKNRENKKSKLPTKLVGAVLSNGEHEPQLVPESSRDQGEADCKVMERGEHDRLGEKPRVLENAENPDLTPQDEFSVALPSVTPIEPKAVSEYALPSKKSKKDKKTAKQTRQAEPAIEPTSKEPLPDIEIGTVNDGSEVIRTSSQPEERESEAMPSVSSSDHVTETSSDPVLAPEFLLPAKRKGKAKKKHKLDLRVQRALSLGDSTPAAEEDTPRQLGLEPVSTAPERSIAADEMEHTAPVLEPESTIEVTETAIGSSAAPDEFTQQDLDSEHASAIPAKEITRSNVQELSPLISAYPHPDDASSTPPLEVELLRPLSPAMIPLPEDEDSGLDDGPTDKELPQEADINHVTPSSEVEKEDVFQANNRASELESTTQSSSTQFVPQMIPLPPDADEELDRSSSALKPSSNTPDALPIEEESRLVQVAPDTTPLPSDEEVGLGPSPALGPLDETPDAFPTKEYPPVRELPEMIPLPSDEDLELLSSPVLKPLDEIPGAFPAAEPPSVKEAPGNFAMPSAEDGEIDHSPTLKPLDETPGAFPMREMPAVLDRPEMVPSPSDENVETDRSPTLEHSTETPGSFPTEQSSSAQTLSPSDEDVELDRSATLKPLSDTPGAFPTGQSPSIQVAPKVKSLLKDKGMGVKNIPDNDKTQAEIAARVSDQTDVMLTVASMNDENVRQIDDMSSSIPLADALPGAFPTKHDTPVQVLVPEMVPLPPDQGKRQTDSLEDSPSRSDNKSYMSEVDEVTPDPRFEETGHMGQEDETLRAAVPDTGLPGAFPTEQNPSVEVTPDEVPLPPDENMDLYNLQDDEKSSGYTKHDAEGIQRRLSSSILATPAIELPGAFPAGRSTSVQASPGYFPSPPKASVDLRDHQEEFQPPEYARTGGDDYKDGMRRQASSSEIATPAIELPGAFPAGQSRLVQEISRDVRSPPTEGVDLRDQQDDLQSPEHFGTSKDNYNDGVRPEANSVGLATPAVELPGAFPAEKSTSVQISRTVIPLPPDENIDVYSPLGDDRFLPTPAVELPGAFPAEQSTSDVPLPPDKDMDVYHPLEGDRHVATPAIELPGAFPGDLGLRRIPSTETGALPKNSKIESQSVIDDEQSRENVSAEGGDVHNDLPASKVSSEGQTSPKPIILPVLKNLLSAVSTSVQTEQSPSAIAPDLIPLPDSSDVDLDDTVNDNQASMESTYDGEVVSAAERGPISLKEGVMQQNTTSSSTSIRPSAEELGSISSSQTPKRSLSSTSVLLSYEATDKALLPEAIPLPEETTPSSQHATEYPVPEDVDLGNAMSGSFRSPANVGLNPESATSTPPPENADLEPLSPEMNPPPESADTVDPLAQKTVLANAVHIEGPPSGIVPQQQDPQPQTLIPEPGSLRAITHSGITSAKTVGLPDGTDYGSLAPGMVPLPYDADSDLPEPSLGAGPIPTAEDVSVETEPSLKEAMPTESSTEVREHAVSRAGEGKTLSEQPEEVVASEFFVPSRKKGKKSKKQQKALASIEDEAPGVDFTEESRSMREVKLQALPDTTADEFSEPRVVPADPIQACEEPDQQEHSAAFDTEIPFDAELQRLTKTGKKNRKNKTLPSPFAAQTTLITPSNPDILSDMPRDSESSTVEAPESVQVSQPSEETPREVQSGTSTPSEGPLGRPLDVMKGLLGMSAKVQKKKGKRDRYLQDPESSSAVSEEPVASAETTREEDQGFETKQSKKTKKGKRKGKVDLSTSAEDTTADAINKGSPATSHLIAVENRTTTEDQRLSTAIERPENEPDTATEPPFKGSAQQSMLTPPLYDSAVVAEHVEGDVNVKSKPRVSDSDYLHEATESQLPLDDPADFPVEEQDREPEAEIYEPSFSLKKSKKAKKSSSKNQAAIQDYEQPASVAVPDLAYQHSTTDTSQKVTNTEPEVIVEPYHALSSVPLVGEPMELPQLPFKEFSTDSFTRSGSPINVITLTEGAEDLSLQTLDTNKGQNLNEPPVISNETSAGSELSWAEQAKFMENMQQQPSVELAAPQNLEVRHPSDALSFTTTPPVLDSQTLAVSELSRVTIEEPNFDKEQPNATAATETPTASDLEFAALEAGLLRSDETPAVCPEEQSAIRSQHNTGPVNYEQEDDSWITGTSGRARKSTKRQKGALVSTRPEEAKGITSDLDEYPEGSSALSGPSHELNRSGNEGVRKPTGFDTVLEPLSAEDEEPQASKLEEDPNGHALDSIGSEAAVSRSPGETPSDVVLDMKTVSHTMPDTINESVVPGTAGVQALTEEGPAEEIGKETGAQEDEWPGGFTTKSKNKKGKKQRRNGRSLLAPEFTEDASSSSTPTEKAQSGSVSPNQQAVPQQLETPMQSNTTLVPLQDAPVASIEEKPSMPRQDDDFLSYTSTKMGKKGKKSKKQPANPAWYDEPTGSGASSPAEAQAALSAPPEAEISRNKVEDAYAEPPAHLHALPERSDVVSRYPDEFMEIPGVAEAESVSAPASKKKGKKGKNSSKQSQGYGEVGGPTPDALPEPTEEARDTTGDGATAVLGMEDASSRDELTLDDLPALPPNRPESRMSDVAQNARTADDLLQDQAVFEPLPASRPTSPTALPFESAAHTKPREEPLRDEMSPTNLQPLRQIRPDSPVITAPEILPQAQLHDKDTGSEIPEDIQPELTRRELSSQLHRSSEPLDLIPENTISTDSNEHIKSYGFPGPSRYLGSQDTPNIEGVQIANEYKDSSHFDKAPRPLDATLGLEWQPAKEKAKKEKRKNKKQKKTFEWVEQEENVTTQSTPLDSDKELEPHDEQNNLPSTTSAFRGPEAEQPQKLNIQSEFMPDQDSSIVPLSEHAEEQRIRTPEKVPPASQFNRDSAVHVSDSPLLPHIVPMYNPVRDSGYQDTAASPMAHSTHEFATGSELQSPLHDIRRFPSPDRPLTDPNDAHLTENFAPVDGGPEIESIPKSRSPLRISVELNPAYEVSVSKHPKEVSRSPLSSVGSVDRNRAMPDNTIESNDMVHLSDQPRECDSVLLAQHDQRQPSPVESATKDRSSVLFLSSPPTREDSTDQPTNQSPWQVFHGSAEGISQISPVDGAGSMGGDVEFSGLPHGSPELLVSQAAAAEQGPNTAASHALSHISETPSISLFGGPVGINSDNPFDGSPPLGSLGFNGSERTPLDTIAEHSPEDSPLMKKCRALSDIGSPERGIKSMRRSPTPRSHGHDELQSPPVLGQSITPAPQQHATPPDNGILSTDDFIARLSWPAVDEDNHSVDLDRVKSRNTDRRTSTHSNGSARVKDGEMRSTSGQSIRSGGSINRFRTPDRDQIIRPASGVSNRSASGTPPLRRVDRRLSGDLRAANKRSEAKFLAKQPDLGFDVDLHIPSSSTYDPIKDKGKGRVRGMTDVYEGWGDVPGSPLSPTRPPSVRRRQSMQIIDLETKVDQLASENRLLQDAKSIAEKGIQELGYAHDRNENAAKEALETRDLHLREKDSEILKLRETLEWVQKEVARLTEVNDSLAATNLSLSSNQDHRYSQLQLEHETTKQQWQQSTRELEELRQQHVHLSTGMEDIVRHEISIALDDKNAEVRRLRDELKAARDQIRALQQQILASKPSDDLLITRDEDYFDSQCQQLCQHVQQWVMRFSKFSDSKPCRLTGEVTDEKITDRFDNAILDGSDVDNYLADRKRRRDVFMSVVMTMVWEFIFTRYLFGMDREQRQKLKSLEKLLGEVGPMKAVHRWRATTLMLLSRRQAFQAQRAQDTEAVVQEIFQTLSTFLPPPSQYVKQVKESLRLVMKCAVDLSIEMRTQRAEYIMLPPLQPEYDTNGDLVRKVYFNAAVMNERSGNTSSNEELEAQHAVVRIVLFPLVVKKGDDAGVGMEEIVVCPAQVLVAKTGKEKKVVRVLSGDRMSVDQATKSVLSFAPSSMDMGNMI